MDFDLSSNTWWARGRPINNVHANICKYIHTYNGASLKKIDEFSGISGRLYFYFLYRYAKWQGLSQIKKELLLCMYICTERTWLRFPALIGRWSMKMVCHVTKTSVCTCTYVLHRCVRTAFVVPELLSLYGGGHLNQPNGDNPLRWVIVMISHDA